MASVVHRYTGNEFNTLSDQIFDFELLIQHKIIIYIYNIYIFQPCFVNKGLSASAKSINLHQFCKGKNFFSIFRFSACQRIILQFIPLPNDKF